MFFDNATIAALYSNNHGGYKAALIMPFIAGVCQVLGYALIAHWTLLDQYSGYSGMWDWAIVWQAFTALVHYLGCIGFAVVIVGLIIVPQRQYMSNPKCLILKPIA